MTCGRLRAISIVSMRHNSNKECHANRGTPCENSGHEVRTIGGTPTIASTGFTSASDALGSALIHVASIVFTSAGHAWGYAIIPAVGTGFISADGGEMAPDTPTYIHGHYRITRSV